ncbi:hypothetical protein NDU88_001424 [Pleurodeles waltl]|uniref:Uncharacterized protein n=1 Tax=Pleurodeles waltl TaxID=8319 RepID=A0AAV7USR6_PLEWA|nr:hypothetical protein NDU88_001424 [Pleurodeles waltl]
MPRNQPEPPTLAAASTRVTLDASAVKTEDWSLLQARFLLKALRREADDPRANIAGIVHTTQQYLGRVARPVGAQRTELESTCEGPDPGAAALHWVHAPTTFSTCGATEYMHAY